MTLNADWQARSLSKVWHPCTQMKRASRAPPLPISRGSGVWLEDFEGKRYFDATSSWWVNLFGHADARQLDLLPHVMLAGCTHAPAVELAERLSALTGNVLGHCFFASDGSSAIEIALKMSFQYWRNAGRGTSDGAKQQFVSLRHGYHGETLGALAVTDIPAFKGIFAPMLMPSHVAMSPDARQAERGESPADVAARALLDLRTLLATHHALIAAIVVEPLVQCAGGMAMHDPAYLRGVRALCDEFDVHLIADEIAVGCGRTGTFFAFEQAAQSEGPAIWPDFMCLSKGITGGYLPLSLVMTRDDIYDAFLDDESARGFLHSHSYTGNALACRAALAVLDRFDSDAVLRVNGERAPALTKALSPLIGDSRVENFRHLGMIWAFDVKRELAGGHFAERFHLAGRDRELLIRPIGRTVYLLPPYLLDDHMSVWLGERVIATLDAVTSSEPDHVDSTPRPALA
jgi:adenosylmethionine-8-amino-7-oxononanoate aminotransferase